MREFKYEDPSELELGLEFELESQDVDAAVAAVAAASEGQIPCSCCNEFLDNVDQLHVHQTRQHSVGELSLALISLRGLDLPSINGGFEANGRLDDDDSSHLKNILLNSVHRPHESDSESTITVSSEARMNFMSPLCSPPFSTSEDLKPTSFVSCGLSCESNCFTNSYSDNLYKKTALVENTTSNGSGFWPPKGTRKIVKTSSVGQRKSKTNNSDDRHFFCDMCGRSYKKKSHLERHIRVHTGVRPYECPMCKKRFAVRSILKQHIRVHTGERPFSCNVCFQRFPQKSGLMTHMMLHNGKPFKCEYCIKSFVSNHKLMLHHRSHVKMLEGATHLGPYSCSNCDMRFFTTGALSQHMNVHIIPKNRSPSKRSCTNESVTISEEAAIVAASAVGKFSDDFSVFQDDLLDIVKNEVIFEDDYESSMNDTTFFCGSSWNDLESMGFESQLSDLC